MTDDPTAAATPFDAIRQTDGAREYWSARDLAKLLGYALWQNFQVAVRRAIVACEQSGRAPTDHFIETNKMIATGKGAHRRVADWHLSRYACYLVVQNADPNKPIVALGQTYFAVQTRTAELAQITDPAQRRYLHGLLAEETTALARTAKTAGVITPAAFAVFQDHGYRGLYGGLDQAALAARRALPAEALTDHMDSEELAANLFRESQAGARLRREGITDPATAGTIHHEVGAAIRTVIANQGNLLPEDLPPAPSIHLLPAEGGEP
jgi:DNA-damage-inducible protein D